MVNFLILVILHFIGDFYLQILKITKCKSDNIGNGLNNFKNSKYLILSAFIYVIPFLFLFFMTEWINILVIIPFLYVVHYVIDDASCYLRNKTKQTVVFIGRQALCVAILFLTYTFVDFNYNFIKYELIIKIIFASLFLIVPSSILINKLFQDLFPETSNEKIFDIGSIIGILERILVLIFACFGDFAAIAIIITVKTWARSNDLKEKNNFRDKYLLGTLASLVLALIAFLIFKI